MSITAVPAHDQNRLGLWRVRSDEPPVVKIDNTVYRVHPHGGGLVALTASVSAEVYVGRRATIRDWAVVVGNVRLFDEAVVEENAIVAGMCTLRDRACVSGEAVLRGNVKLTDAARADGFVRLSGSVKLSNFAHVSSGIITGGITLS